MDKSNIFVGRQAEIEMLGKYLEKSLHGEPQLVFVSGEAGVGKSSLLQEFLEKTLFANPKVVSAVANCNASFGKGDPLLPWRSVAEQLLNPKKNKLKSVGNLAKTAGEFVLEIAPDTVGVFFPIIGPLASTFTKMVKAASEINKIPKPDDNTSSKRSMVFEQFSRLLFKFSKKSPLVIILEDMQWADESTIEFLFHLTRSWEKQRILIVATYREEDLVSNIGEHPLRVVEHEMVAHNLCCKISLGWLDESGIEIWLSELFPKNKIPNGFSKWLLSRTEGNALFINEILKDMQEQKVLFKDNLGYWVLSQDIMGPEQLPSSIEAVIEQRLGRLEHRLLEVLNYASVEGEEFTAEVISTIRKIDLDQVIDELIDILGRQYWLISAKKDERKIPKQHIVSLFNFRHTLIQMYLYKKLDPIRRRRFHLAVGSCLEELYGDQKNQIAVSLARHFAEGGDMQRAYQYAKLSAKIAENLYDYRVAREWIRKAIEYADDFDISIDEMSELWHSLGKAESRVGSFTDATSYFNRALELLGDTNNKKIRPDILMELGYCYIQTNKSHEAVKVVKEALAIYQQVNNLGQVAFGMAQLAFAYHKSEQQHLAKDSLLKALELFETLNDSVGLAYVNRHLGINYRIENDFENSVKHLEEAAQLDKKTGNQFDESSDYTNLGSTYLMLRDDYAHALEYYQKSLKISRHISKVHEEGHVLLNMARLYALQGEWDDALKCVEDGLEKSKLVGEDSNITRGLWYLGIIKYYRGFAEQGLEDYKSLLASSGHETREMWGMFYNYASLLLIHNKVEDAFNSYFEACKLLLKIAKEMPKEQQTPFLNLQGKTNIFIAMLDLSNKTNNHEKAQTIIDDLPQDFEIKPNQDYPKFYWGSGKWI